VAAKCEGERSGAGVLKKMLEVSVRHRYQSAREILRAMDLEPYLDSLAQSMLANRTTSSQRGSNRPGSANSGRFNPGSSGSKQSDRMAMRIRGRNAKLEGSHLDTGGMGRRGPDSSYLRKFWRQPGSWPQQQDQNFY